MDGLSEGKVLKRFVDSLGEEPCECAIILGSGLGALAERVMQSRTVAYEDIPGFPSAGVSGHVGRLVLGELGGKRVALFQGRFHLYEGYTAREASISVRLAHALGCRRILLSCAAGGVRTGFQPGDFMIIEDHLNLMGDNPLRGEREAPFVDLAGLYCHDLCRQLQAVAEKENIRIHRGVLAALAGPSYETPAEIRMVERLGGDAVSMSIVPEAIMARYLGIEVCAIAFISNLASGLSPEILDHRDVLARGREGGANFCVLACRLLENW